jgi:ubiquinone/menaquinone biosynthesis C-methylase UbiE
MPNPGFAVFEDRIKKARKIDAVLVEGYGDTIESLNILDIGCGNGEIASYFASTNTVYGVDLIDQLDPCCSRQIEFRVVNSEALPFSDNAFDVVISNHVVEHLTQQDAHLREIRRVLKSSGCCYFATPNWNFPIEPHYRIPLMHYLPRTVFHHLLKKMGLYRENLNLLSYIQMKKKCTSAGFHVREFTAEVLKYPEKYQWTSLSFPSMPLAILSFLVFFSQTNIFVLTIKK